MTCKSQEWGQRKWFWGGGESLGAKFARGLIRQGKKMVWSGRFKGEREPFFEVEKLITQQKGI